MRKKPRLPAYYQEGFPKYQPPHEFPGIFVAAFPYSRDYFQFHSYFCFDRTTGINNSCSTENQEFLYKISNEEFSLQTQQAGVSSRKSRTRNVLQKITNAAKIFSHRGGNTCAASQYRQITSAYVHRKLHEHIPVSRTFEHTVPHRPS